MSAGRAPGIVCDQGAGAGNSVRCFESLLRSRG